MTFNRGTWIGQIATGQGTHSGGTAGIKRERDAQIRHLVIILGDHSQVVALNVQFDPTGFDNEDFEFFDSLIFEPRLINRRLIVVLDANSLTGPRVIDLVTNVLGFGK